jgi:UDP-N-acetylmuramate dehydrogenase
MILAERMMADTPLPPTYMTPGIPGAQGRLELGADMARHTSWRAGGRADRFYTPANLDDLAAFLGGLEPEEPVWFVGLGSNLLVRDGGLRGTVIHLHGALRNIAIEQRRQNGWAGQDSGKFGVIYAEAGVASPKVARFAATHDLVGAEFLAGIPGTVGGALAMNAGCYGHDTWEFVSQVLTIDRQGRINRRGPKDFQVAYRHVAPRRAARGMVRGGLVHVSQGGRRPGPGRDQAAAGKTHRHAAPGFAQRRLGVPQSARRFRGASDRILRPQGPSHRRRPGFRKNTPISSSTPAAPAPPTSRR